MQERCLLSAGFCFKGSGLWNLGLIGQQHFKRSISRLTKLVYLFKKVSGRGGGTAMLFKWPPQRYLTEEKSWIWFPEFCCHRVIQPDKSLRIGSVFDAENDWEDPVAILQRIRLSWAQNQLSLPPGKAIIIEMRSEVALNCGDWRLRVYIPTLGLI